MTRALPLLSLLAVSGCVIPLAGAMRPSSKPLELKANPTTARLLFVRQDTFAGSNVSAYFFDTQRGVVFGKSVNNSAFTVDVEPGEYQVCAMPYFEQAARQFQPEEGGSLGVRTPITRMTVAAGKVYTLLVELEWGPVIEARPVRPGTKREAYASGLVATVRAAEPVPEATELKQLSGPELLEWTEACVNSSGVDRRLRMSDSDGR